MVKYYYDKFAISYIAKHADAWNWTYDRQEPIEYNKVYQFASLLTARQVGGGVWEFEESANRVSIGQSSPVGTQGYDNKGTYAEKARKLQTNDIAYYRSEKSDITSTPTKMGIVTANIIAENGTYPVDGPHTDGFWYVRKGVVNTAPSTPGAFTQPTGSLEAGTSKVVSWGASSDAEGNLSKYVLEAAIGPAGWVVIAQPTTPTFSYTVPATTAVTFRVKAADAAGLESAYTQSQTFAVNAKPTLALNTANNQTLYENDTFTIDGSATDTNVGDIVNVYYRINGGASHAIATGISSGAAIPFNEQLLFKAGMLHKDGVAVTGSLTEGPAHKLEVWAEDNKGGKSTVQERTFYVVPNRPPALTVDPFSDQAGMINNDKITISGASSDPDGNDVKVAYKVNSHAAVQIHSGVAGPWTFDLSLKDLNDGENIIVAEVTDTYDFKSSKTIKLNKTANLTPLSASVQRYQIVPPSGSAQGVLLWIQREETQTISAEISMTTGSEQEQFAAMTLGNTAPVTAGIVEDEFTYQASAAKENIYVKLNITGTGAVTLISGVLSQ